MKNFNRYNGSVLSIVRYLSNDNPIVWTPAMAAEAKAQQAERFATSAIPVK
jgi:hypothetical protein